MEGQKVDQRRRFTLVCYNCSFVFNGHREKREIEGSMGL